MRKEYNYEVQKVISLITTLAMCISMFSAFSVTSFAENDNTYSCDFTSLVKDNADTTYGTADDIYDIDDYTKSSFNVCRNICIGRRKGFT